MARKLVGQDAAIKAIVPFIQMHQAGLAAEGRPVGVFMLLSPTGTGKTRTVEALAEVLHGSAKKMVKVDCGEFQNGTGGGQTTGRASGISGHRETTPLLTQQKLAGVTSEDSDLSILLFDEVEKVAPSLSRILAGVLDKATLRLSDNTTVNFRKIHHFLDEQSWRTHHDQRIESDFGFRAFVPRDSRDTAAKLQNIGTNAVKKKFSPEFVNRIDSVVIYEPLTQEALATILDRQLFELQ